MSSVPLVISMGDPCGIGPEIITKAWNALKTCSDQTFFVIGDSRCLKDSVIISDPSQAQSQFSKAIPVLHRPLAQPAVLGKPDPVHAPFIIDWIKEAVHLCLDHKARGLITAPIAKSVLYQTGFEFPGHTEYLAELTKHIPWPNRKRGPVMMLSAKDLRVVLATIHLPLRQVADALNAKDLSHVIEVTHEALCHDMGIQNPRLVLAGLNPHAGEDGSLGREDIDLLAPVVASLKDRINITGPFPADTLFHEEARNAYDCVVCLYHDQGLIPLKTLDFWGGVNTTLGLPIIRTSPDHGTGFSIAQKGIARPDSLIAAIYIAHHLSLTP